LDAYRGHGLRNWSAEHRLGALEAVWKLGEAVLGAPVHGKAWLWRQAEVQPSQSYTLSLQSSCTPMSKNNHCIKITIKYYFVIVLQAYFGNFIKFF